MSQSGSGSGSCPRCGSVLPPLDAPRPGRRRVWCSDSCRRAAHLERSAAAMAGMPVRVVEIPRVSPAVQIPVIVPRDLRTSELVAAVLADRDALRLLLDKLTYQARNRTLDRTVRSDCYELARVLLPNATRY